MTVARALGATPARLMLSCADSNSPHALATASKARTGGPPEQALDAMARVGVASRRRNQMMKKA